MVSFPATQPPSPPTAPPEKWQIARPAHSPHTFAIAKTWGTVTLLVVSGAGEGEESGLIQHSLGSLLLLVCGNKQFRLRTLFEQMPSQIATVSHVFSLLSTDCKTSR